MSADEVAAQKLEAVLTSTNEGTLKLAHFLEAITVHHGERFLDWILGVEQKDETEFIERAMTAAFGANTAALPVSKIAAALWEDQMRRSYAIMYHECITDIAEMEDPTCRVCHSLFTPIFLFNIGPDDPNFIPGCAKCMGGTWIAQHEGKVIKI